MKYEYETAVYMVFLVTWCSFGVTPLIIVVSLILAMAS